MTVGKLMQALSETDPNFEIVVVTGICGGNKIDGLHLVYEEDGGVTFDTNKVPSQPEKVHKMLAQA